SDLARPFRPDRGAVGAPVSAAQGARDQMSVPRDTAAPLALGRPAIRSAGLRYLDLGGLVLTVVTVIAAGIWALPLYSAIITTLKPEYEVVEPGIRLWPREFTVAAYVHVLVNTNIGIWYLNSLVTSAAVTVLVVFMGATCGYAISQLSFPGRSLLYWMILAS